MTFTETRRKFVAMIAIIWGLACLFSSPIASAQSATMEIVGLGDSLMAGYELPVEQGFPARLEVALKARGHDVRVINAGVSGDTSTGGLERLDWSVPDTTRLVILELGANDALRGVAPAITRTNIDAMLKRLKERNIGVVLAGMLSPPNMGADYEAAFNPIFPELAAKYQVPLIPFFLNGVAGHPDLQLQDGMHPNAKGVDVMVENALPLIEAEIMRLRQTQ